MSILSAAITAPSQAGAVPSKPKNKSFHIASLDGIRGAAFLLVFLGHAGLGWVIPGGFGVTVFFVLSGYLITTLLRQEAAETGTLDFKAFYVRRALRILPVFYLVVAAATLLRWAGVLGGGLSLVGVISQVTHWTNYYLMHYPQSVVAGMQVYWSLSVEEHFYLLFPLLYWCLSQRLSRKQQAWFLFAGCMLCLCWRCFNLMVLHFPTVHNEIGTDGRFDCLLFGCILAIAANPVLDDSPWLKRQRLKWMALLGVAVLLLTFVIRNVEFRFTLRFTLQAMALLPIFCYVILARGTRLYRILNSKVMSQLGVLSYALYLIHYIVLRWFSGHTHLNKVSTGILTFIVSLGMAKFLQVIVERPMLRLRRRYSRVHA